MAVLLNGVRLDQGGYGYGYGYRYAYGYEKKTGIWERIREVVAR